ncbi:hypothetical protein GWK47_017747 [Chionoecetes opilio]|uniref:Uncharacterized protein n=1 Tax=Chionoecetes opilio TaxID=41210 RepID=A0A8J5CLY8_CHIOP|nr:hypothetical protein GWK47_017747 [Chionoecetes opilio]
MTVKYKVRGVAVRAWSWRGSEAQRRPLRGHCANLGAVLYPAIHPPRPAPPRPASSRLGRSRGRGLEGLDIITHPPTSLDVFIHTDHHFKLMAINIFCCYNDYFLQYLRHFVFFGIS